MKNEALQDAISMLDDKYIEEAQKPFAKRKTAPTAIKICFAAAACAAAVCAFVFFPRGRAADILVFGEIRLQVLLRYAAMTMKPALFGRMRSKALTFP